jgi:hypothetical protein
VIRACPPGLAERGLGSPPPQGRALWAAEGQVGEPAPGRPRARFMSVFQDVEIAEMGYQGHARGV